MRIPTAASAVFLAAAFALCPVRLQAQGGPASRPALPEGSEWTATESGLRYVVLEPGEGSPEATVGTRVSAHYTGWLKSNGNKFDSSYDRGQPFSFTVGAGVIEGWSEVAQLMPTGSKFRVEIPPALGYGEQGSPGAIPPNATLIFDIELVEVFPKPPTFAPADPDSVETVEDGLTFEVVREGAGDPCTDKDAFKMHFSLYTADGKLMQSSVPQGQPISLTVDRAPLPVFKKMATRMKPGMLVRCETNAAQGLGARQPPGAETVVWYLEMVEVLKPLPVPEFGVPAEGDIDGKSETGLQWKIVKPGREDGPRPKPTDVVKVHYAGRLDDGTVFDSSFSRGEPITFPLNRVIAGWTEGVGMMTPGETRILVIPSSLGYGASGQPPTIPPNATLTFWVELIEIQGS